MKLFPLNDNAQFGLRLCRETNRRVCVSLIWERGGGSSEAPQTRMCTGKEEFLNQPHLKLIDKENGRHLQNGRCHRNGEIQKANQTIISLIFTRRAQ